MKRKTILLLLLAVVCSLSAQAQRPEADQVKTKSGVVRLQPIQHGSVALSWNNKTIFVDPYGNVVSVVPPAAYESRIFTSPGFPHRCSM